jgi:RecB family endonuclease NucS
MEMIKIWKIGSENERPKAIPVDTVTETTTERLLEDVLAGSADLLMPNLHLIGRQTDTTGGPLDLIGVDEDGHLVVFELKRGTLTREAVHKRLIMHLS